MTKKHFISLAGYVMDIEDEIIRRVRGEELLLTPEFVCHILEERLAEFCHSFNPHFKKDRWIGYIKGECGSSGGKR